MKEQVKLVLVETTNIKYQKIEDQSWVEKISKIVCRSSNKRMCLSIFTQKKSSMYQTPDIFDLSVSKHTNVFVDRKLVEIVLGPNAMTFLLVSAKSKHPLRTSDE